MPNKIELVEEISDSNNKYLDSPVIDGDNARMLKDYLDENVGEKVSENVFKNAYQGLRHFINPRFDYDDNCLSKILALGRVQSGKTSFFISSISLAFDNGYDLVYLIGGTKNTLRDQNYERVDEYFKNNPNIRVYDINEVDYSTVLNKLSIGYKVVLVVLKNAAENANLGKAYQIALECDNIPSLVVDDEGDEYTPGAPKLINKTNRIGATHDKIAEIIYSIKRCTFLSVTATPQANFLISTIDAVSPDFAVLVEPGDEYTGGNSFHDTIDNPHVVDILDTDDFKDSVPESFMDALFFFMFAVCYKRSCGDYSKYSMLVHPSSLTKVQNAVIEKINDRLETIINTLSDSNNIEYEATVQRVLDHIKTYKEMNPDLNVSINKEAVREELIECVSELSSFEFNISASGREDIAREKDDKSLYKIYVGGNMLGRGLTLKNLIVTYMYRDSKVQAVDTLYQRARWLGYKRRYFDVCRVYMTDQLKQKFVVIVENENDMWETLRNYLAVDDNIKKFPRIFQLNDESGKMILTRKTVSKTVTVDRVNPGFTYDKSIWFNDEAKQLNRDLYQNYFATHKDDSFVQSFSTNNTQNHLIIKTTYTKFYDEFLSKYILPRGSKFGPLGFKKVLQQIAAGEVSDELYVIVMRYSTMEQRSPVSNGSLSIKELPQSYNNGTNYSGDKDLPGYKDAAHFQIHLVYLSDETKADYMPMLAFNNPLSKHSIKYIKYVTGDNTYD